MKLPNSTNSYRFGNYFAALESTNREAWSEGCPLCLVLVQIYAEFHEAVRPWQKCSGETPRKLLLWK